MVTHNNTVTMVTHNNTVTMVTHNNTVTMVTHNTTVTIVTHNNTVSMVTNDNTVTMATHHNTVTMVIHNNTVTMATHNNTVTMVSHNNTVTMVTHNNTVTVVTHYNTVTITHDMFCYEKNEPKIKNPPCLVFAKSIFTSILKVSDKFMEECRRSHLAKWDSEIWPFLCFLVAKVVNLGIIGFQLCPFISIEMMGKTNLKFISQKIKQKSLIFGLK